MGVVRGAVVGAKKPPFGQRGDPVHAGQRRVGLPAGAGLPLVEVAARGGLAVGLPAVGDDGGALLDVIGKEGAQVSVLASGSTAIRQRPSPRGWTRSTAM